MKKRFLLQPLTVGLAAALFAVPVFAQEQSEVAQNAAVLVEAANVSVPQAEPVEEVVETTSEEVEEEENPVANIEKMVQAYR